MTSTTKKANVRGSIEALLAELSTEKSAEAHTEPGGYQGATTHPSKDVDDRTDNAQEGARTAENEDDAKTQPNRGQPVDSTTPGPGAGQDSVQTDIGITSKATGEDPSSETDSAKSTKHDDGYEAPSSHPARTDNSELDGHKYANDTEAFLALTKQAEDIGKALLAQIATDAATPAKQAAGKADASAAGSTNSQAGGVGVQEGPITTEGKVNARDESGNNPAGKEAAQRAEQAGYDLAGLFAGMDIPVEDKQAADAFVVDTLEDIFQTAQRRAVKTAQFLDSHYKAAAEGEEGDDSEGGGGEENPSQAAPAEAAAGGAPSAGGGDAELMALLGSGAGGGEPPPAPAGGGEVPGADAALAGMTGEGGGAGPDAGGGDDAAAMLEQALMELGITPEQLLEAISGLGGEAGGMGGAAGGAAGGEAAGLAGGAPPPPDAAGGAMPPKVAASRQVAAKSPAGKQASAAMQNVVRELAKRSRT